MDITVEIDGITRVIGTLDKLANNTSNHKEVFEDIVADFHVIEKEQFQSEGRRGASGRWTPLNPRYTQVKNRITRGKITLINELTGNLRESFIRSKAEGNIERITKDSIEMGSNLKQAAWLHEGRGNYPARKLIDLKPEDFNRWFDMINDHIWKGIK